MDFVLYCDMDGVLTDFDQAVLRFYHEEYIPSQKKYQPVSYLKGSELQAHMGDPGWYRFVSRTTETFWAEMPWLEEGRELWSAISPLKPIILSTPFPHASCKNGKRLWVEKNLGPVPVLLERNKERFVHNPQFLEVEKLNLKRVLIDDRQKILDRWILAGGTGILHTSCKDTLNQLQAL